jgi:CheY-like chemotaxis protein
VEKSAPILHVEDDLVDVTNLQRAFARRGITNPLRAAGNGEVALRQLRAADDTKIRPALILLDLGMPVMGGLELLKELKNDAALRAIPTVVLTASSREEEVSSAYELGAAGYVVKPIAFDDLAAAVELVVRYWTLCRSGPAGHSSVRHPT